MNQPFRKTIPYLFSVLILTVLFLISCEEAPNDMGRILIPDSMNVFIDTTELIQTFTIAGDSVVTNQKTIQLLGDGTDPMFGISKSELITQINLLKADTFSFGTSPKADSVIFQLKFYDYTGDPTSLLVVSLFEYTDEIRTDTNIYSNQDITGKYNPVILGSGNVNFTDSILRIRITNDEFIQRFFDAEDTMFMNNDNLRLLLKGLYLHAESQSSEGAILLINFANDPASLSFYYYDQNGEDSLSYHLEIGSVSRHFNIFHHEYEGFPVDEFLSDNSENDSLIFVQSMAGVKSIIRLPELQSWIDSMPVAINHAQLVLTPADSSVTHLSRDEYPPKLLMYLVNPEGGYKYVYDYLINSGTYGGEYNNETNSYIFNIKIHIQSYLKGIIENLDFVLLPYNNSETTKQVILNGANYQGKDRITIEIVYAPL